MRIEELLVDPRRREHAAMPEADALTESDALQEAQLLDVRLDALRSTVWLLFDCRGALQIWATRRSSLRKDCVGFPGQDSREADLPHGPWSGPNRSPVVGCGHCLSRSFQVPDWNWKQTPPSTLWGTCLAAMKRHPTTPKLTTQPSERVYRVGLRHSSRSMPSSSARRCPTQVDQPASCCDPWRAMTLLEDWRLQVVPSGGAC
jgi:hypothetical protein